FTLSLSTSVPLLAAVMGVGAVPAVAPHDVFAPPVTFPTAGTVWATNSRQNVTWDASGAPARISNEALLMLRKNSVAAPHPFDLRAGTLEITVPYVLAGSDYQLVLFGDSGEFIPVFTIQSDMFAE
ncbi:hypothetical protein DFH07DRAFT_760872, partial [Mycena maculata]